MSGQQREDPLHVVIVGGGFAGLFAARRLARGPVQITVLDRTGVHLFQPLLYQVATGLLSEGQISCAAPSPVPPAPQRRDPGRGGHPRRRRCAGGARTDAPTDGPPGSLRRASSSPPASSSPTSGMTSTPARARHQDPRRRAGDPAPGVQAFETAETLPTAEERRPWLTFALVGGGPTGVELAGQIRELATRTLRDEFRTIDPAEATGPALRRW